MTDPYATTRSWRSGWAPQSLRARLLLLTIALLATGLTSGSVVVINSLRKDLVDRVDDALRSSAQIMARLPPFAMRAPGQDDEPADLPGANVLESPTIIYLDADGTVERRSEPAGSGPRLPVLDEAAVAERGGRPFQVADEDGGSDWRAIALPRDSVVNTAPSGGSVVVAGSLGSVDVTIARLRTISVTTGAALLVVLAGAGWFAIRAGLRPLSEVERTATAIADGDLSRRLPNPAHPDTEVGRMSVALNGMLAQIDDAMTSRALSEARMRRFVADASHELRTPLVGIKGFTELYQMGALANQGDVDRVMTRIAEESERLTRLVEDMLLLAQLDRHDLHVATEPTLASSFPLQLAPMDLRTLAVDAFHDVRALDLSRPVTLTGPDGGAPTSAPTIGDEARLRQVVSNLVGNAVTHTPPGTPVWIRVGKVAEHAILEVADDGPGMGEEQAARIFERFYRLDDSRSRVTGGAGLGLAIVESLVATHGGRVELRTSPGAGAAFRVILPALSDDPDG